MVVDVPLAILLILMLIVIACMYIWEQKDMQANTPSQENCDIPVTPQLELIEY